MDGLQYLKLKTVLLICYNFHILVVNVPNLIAIVYSTSSQLGFPSHKNIKPQNCLEPVATESNSTS